MNTKKISVSCLDCGVVLLEAVSETYAIQPMMSFCMKCYEVKLRK